MMLQPYNALSIVAPSGCNIAKKIKSLEIRRWQPQKLPLTNVLIVENQHYLVDDHDEELGIGVALVDIIAVHPWREDEVEAACATYWVAGYWAWEIANVRPILPIQVIAKRKLYTVDVDIHLEI